MKSRSHGLRALSVRAAIVLATLASAPEAARAESPGDFLVPTGAP